MSKMSAELNYKEEWAGDYRDVRLEVAHWRLGWNYYLFIPLEQLPLEQRKVFNLRSKTYQLSPNSRERIHFDYSGAPIISDLDWHGGITLYEKKRDERGKLIGFRLGCDYMHSFDEMTHYDLDYVLSEAQHSIDKLYEYIPNLKLRCAWDGKYYAREEGFHTDKGVFVADENKEKWEKPI